MSATALQVDDFHNAFLIEKVVASANVLLESQILHQGSQVGEPDVCVRPSAEDGLQQSLMPVHGRTADAVEDLPHGDAREADGLVGD